MESQAKKGFMLEKRLVCGIVMAVGLVASTYSLWHYSISFERLINVRHMFVMFAIGFPGFLSGFLFLHRFISDVEVRISQYFITAIAGVGCVVLVIFSISLLVFLNGLRLGIIGFLDQGFFLQLPAYIVFGSVSFPQAFPISIVAAILAQHIWLARLRAKERRRNQN